MNTVEIILAHRAELESRICKVDDDRVLATLCRELDRNTEALIREWGNKAK